MTLPSLLSLSLATLLCTLAGIHIYWASGGGWGKAVAVPHIQGRPAFAPGPVATRIVALLLLLGAATALGTIGIFGHDRTLLVMSTWGVWGLSVVFFLRAIGDFNHCGLCKRVRDTPFAYWDTRLYSPLCLVLSGLACLLALSAP